MKPSNRVIAIGMAGGIALLVAGGLRVLLGAGNWESGSALNVGPITNSVIAPAQQLSDAFAMVAAHVRPAVVSVFSTKSINIQNDEGQNPFGDEFFRRFFGDQAPHMPQMPDNPRQFKGLQHGMGSGMILDEEGHILTNNHVVEDESSLQVQLADERKFDAEVVSTDPKTDVAIIKIKGDVPKDLPTVQLGDSDALRPGDLVMAVGAPFGFQQTVTHGIISATGRSNVGIADFEDFLQTDAPIDPGNSGGPLVNMRGEVIGMNSAIATSVGQFSGVGFAIPINMIKNMMPTLIKGGKIIRGMLGVEIQNLNQGLADSFKLPNTNGALVSQVVKDSPAEKAGIKVGDAIVKFDDKEVKDTTQLRNMVAATAPGSNVKLQIIRDGKEQTVETTVGTLTAEAAATPAAPGGEGADQLAKLGLSVQNLTPDLANQLGISGDQGVVITQVQEGSPASLADLQPGDLIVQCNREPVTNVDQLQSALPKSKDTVLLLIKRKDVSLYVTLSVK
jgi:serine protease Do